MKVIGYKWVQVDTSPRQLHRVALVSGWDAREWTRGTNCASYTPSSDEPWGFNAYLSARRARWSGQVYGTAMVGVVGCGVVALFDHGWRAEKAEIVAICIPRLSRYRVAGDVPLAEVIARLRAAYDVPVFRSVRHLRKETERWGISAKIFLAGDYQQSIY
jgi:hypothetical protein